MALLLIVTSKASYLHAVVISPFCFFRKKSLPQWNFECSWQRLLAEICHKYLVWKIKGKVATFLTMTFECRFFVIYIKWVFRSAIVTCSIKFLLQHTWLVLISVVRIWITVLFILLLHPCLNGSICCYYATLERKRKMWLHAKREYVRQIWYFRMTITIRKMTFSPGAPVHNHGEIFVWTVRILLVRIFTIYYLTII